MMSVEESRILYASVNYLLVSQYLATISGVATNVLFRNVSVRIVLDVPRFPLWDGCRIHVDQHVTETYKDSDYLENGEK